MLSKNQQFSKRMFDLLLSIIVFPLLLVPGLILILFATLSTGQNGLFIQERIGRRGRAFRMYKIRSLRGSGHKDVIDIKEDETSFGAWLRRTKLDELPQVLNVLIGNMSWVGPRPDVPGYADLLVGEDRIILQLRPGITGPATLKYKNEDELLMKQRDPLQYNDEVIWPDKVKINKEYMQHWSLAKDMGYLWKSIFN